MRTRSSAPFIAPAACGAKSRGNRATVFTFHYIGEDQMNIQRIMIGLSFVAATCIAVPALAAPPAQPPPPPRCSYVLNPTSIAPSAAGGPSLVRVTLTQPTCVSWNTKSNVPWINLTSEGFGRRNGSVGISVKQNLGGARIGTITIGSNQSNSVFTVNQAAATGK
jgi:hypothetical protein